MYICAWDAHHLHWSVNEVVVVNGLECLSSNIASCEDLIFKKKGDEYSCFLLCCIPSILNLLVFLAVRCGKGQPSLNRRPNQSAVACPYFDNLKPYSLLKKLVILII